jgi:hypothetical protein
MDTIKAVISADIVNSSLLYKGELNVLLKSISKLFNNKGIKHGYYRGDSIQAICEPEAALKVCCLLRTLAITFSKKEEKKEIDIRMSIGIGNIDKPVRDLGTAKGEAFILSGRAMEYLEKTNLRLTIRCKDAIADTGFSAIALFTDYILKNLTVKQSEVIHELLKGFNQVQAANSLHKSQSTINKHAASGNWSEMIKLLNIYELLTSRIEG